jgi:hypothetical protein
MLKGLLTGCLLTVVILACGFYYYFASGMAPVPTADTPVPFEKKLANKSLDAHIEKQHIAQSPVATDEVTFLAGAGVYKQHCPIVGCTCIPGTSSTTRSWIPTIRAGLEASNSFRQRASPTTSTTSGQPRLRSIPMTARCANSSRSMTSFTKSRQS